MKIKNSVECWLLHGADSPRVLLLQVPAKVGGHDAFWQPITGGIESGESPREACSREIREETGINIDNSDLIQVSTEFDVVISSDLTVRKSIFAAYIADPHVRINPDEHQDHRWVPPDVVESQLFWDSNRDTWKLVTDVLALHVGSGADEGYDTP